MSVIIGNQLYQNPLNLRGKIQEHASTVLKTQDLVDQIEIWADGYLALDNTSTDENRRKDQVTFIEDELYVHAKAKKSGEIEEFEMIDQRNGETTEFRKSLSDGRASYEISMSGQTITVAEDANGTLVVDISQ